MKIVVIGGSGRVGANVVRRLLADGHDPVPASPATGVDTITGEGLADVMAVADVVVDVSNAPVWDDDAVREFFTLDTQPAGSRARGLSDTTLRCRRHRLPDNGPHKVAQGGRDRGRPLHHPARHPVLEFPAPDRRGRWRAPASGCRRLSSSPPTVAPRWPSCAGARGSAAGHLGVGRG
jgi:hypothetical protein